MPDQTPLENADRLATALSPEEQTQLMARIGGRLSKTPPDGSARAGTSELQRMEAEWVARELDEFVKLIQRYRALYVSAIFLAVGWVLGQAVGGGGSATGTPPNAGATPPTTLEAFRQRPDIAAVLCVVPLLNVLFAALVAETYAHMKSLARYRFILGCALGDGAPAWRWELWRETDEGSTHSWTNPLNVFSVFILFILTAGALIFPFPAVWNSGSWWLWVLWSLALILPAALIVVLAVLGKRNRHRNAVADPPTKRWSDLQLANKENVDDPKKKESTPGADDARRTSPERPLATAEQNSQVKPKDTKKG